MNATLNAHMQALARALGRMRTQPLATCLSIAVIAIAILLPLGLYVLFDNVINAASHLNTEPNVNVYLKLATSDQEAKDAEKKLRAHSNSAQVTFVSREAALADMRKRANLSDLLADIDTNPLPHAFSIKPLSFEMSILEAMRKEVLSIPKVETVTMDFEWAKQLTRFARFVEHLVILLGGLLGAAVLFVVGNTIRLQMLTQKDEIVVARLIGAPRRFVLRPFLYFGALQGALAGLLAVAATLGIGLWVGGEVNAFVASYGGNFFTQGPSFEQSLSVITVAGIMGWLGALISVSMYWRQIETSR
ncbi:MAG: permease-like cell division protein FtsX [Burkholderiales bacterium]|jgi:cell division transport system permease protein